MGRRQLAAGLAVLVLAGALSVVNPLTLVTEGGRTGSPAEAQATYPPSPGPGAPIGADPAPEEDTPAP